MKRILLGAILLMGLTINAMSMNLSDDESFDFRLLSEIASSQDDPIICVSPLSASVALSMAAEGAKGDTRAEMLKVLGFQNIKELRRYYAHLLDILESKESGISLNMANSLWIADDFSVKRRFKSTLRRYYDAEVSCLDFSEPSSAARINTWCADNTAGKIEEIVQSPMDPSLKMLILNALYFKGEWSEAFNPELTHMDKFHGAYGDVETKFMMKNDVKYKYGVSGSAEILEIPYGKDGNYVMDIVLPSEDMNMEEYLEGFTADIFNELEESMSKRKISHVRIPLFKAECDMSLKGILKNMGIEQAFSSGADFGLISREPLMVDQVKQKTFIEVNEAGTEAAAVTSIAFMKSSIDHDRIDFVADRPFIFIIRECNSGIILFNGVVRGL